MYHYVREFDASRPNFRFLHIDNFRKQLDFFEKEFGFLTLDEWSSFIRDGRPPLLDGKVLLTFDDAMSCHFRYVLPELVERGLWGIFYVPTMPFLRGRMLDVHRIHLLCGAFDGGQLHKLLSEIVTEDMIPHKIRKEFRLRTYQQQVNSDFISDFKRTLNYFVTYDSKTQIIDEISERLNFEFESSNFYVSKTELHEMSSAGMIIGSHSDSHRVMSRLTFDEQKAELLTSFNFVDSFSRGQPRTYCHPYGGFHSFNDATVQLLNSLSVAYSFNVEAREIELADQIGSIQHLPRFDCNSFPYGGAS